MADIIRALAEVRTVIGLAAVAMGIIAYLARRNRLGLRVALTIGGIFVVAVLFSFLTVDRPPSTYHVRLTVVDPQGRPVDDARVVTKSGNEALRVPGGYQIDISSDKLPPDRKIEFIAVQGFNIGEGQVVIGSSQNPTLTIQLAPKTQDVMIGGIVQDIRRNGVEGALVQVVGGQSIMTVRGGRFVLPAGAPVGKKVLLQAEKKGYAAVNQWEEAGNQQVLITLKR